MPSRTAVLTSRPRRPGVTPPHVYPRPDGSYRSRVKLGPGDEVELGVHPDVTSAARAARLFVARSVTDADRRRVVTMLVAEGVVPPGTLPRWVVAVGHRGRTLYRGVFSLRLGRGVVVGDRTRRHRDPWACHEQVRGMMAREVAAFRARKRAPRRDGPPGVKWQSTGCRAQWWDGSRGVLVNLGYWSADEHGEYAGWLAGRAYREFRRLVDAGEEVGTAFRSLVRRGVIPAGTESTYAGGAA